MRPHVAMLLLLCSVAAAGPSGAAMAAGATAGATPTVTTSGAQPAPQLYPTVGKATAPPGLSYALSFKGKAVNFDLSGLEPDFDPIYKLTVTGTLHDKRAARLAFPDATLILSAYLEAFKPDTTPVLPDLLHPDQVAQDLGGFISGKAALVNAGGHVVYRGSLLAEIFQDNTEHLVIDLDPLAKGPTVRLQGIVTLKRGGDEGGALRALSPLGKSVLAVPDGPAISWRDVVSGLNVRKPPMMGTAGSSASRPLAKPPTIAPMEPSAKPAASCDLACHARHPATFASLAAGVAIVLLGIVVSLRRRPRRAAP
jgi:hypothetical protein